jgi:hypothetical protein
MHDRESAISNILADDCGQCELKHKKNLANFYQTN